MVDAIYFPLPRGSFSLVPVFAPTEKPFTEALCPVPSETTLPSAIRIKSEVSFETTRSFFPYEKCFIRLPSALTALTPKCGVMEYPPFIMEPARLTSLIGESWKDWPKDIVASSTAPTFFSLCIMVDASPGTSIPVRFINPKSDILRKKSDTPTRAPTSIKTGLHEFIIPSKKVSLPCPPFL